MTGPGANGFAPRVLALLLALAAAPVAHAAPPAPATLAQAEALLGTPSSSARDRGLKRWAGRAPLLDLLRILDRDPARLGALEAVFVDAAIERAPATRAALRRRLVARLALADPELASRRHGAEALRAARLVRNPRASIFRVALVLPDSGDYAGVASEVAAGVAAGLGLRGEGGQGPIVLGRWRSGEDDPPRAVAALDSAAERVGVVVGELLSVPTLAAATAARHSGVPLVSPTATDEAIGALGSGVFQIGPSGYTRGLRLAEAVLTEPLRIGILASSGTSPSFVAGFRAGAERAHATIVWEHAYPSGNLDFKESARTMVARRVQVLLWDGESREADALVRTLAREKVSVRICGGQVLAPEQFHAEARVLLEGVRYVADEWQLPSALADTLARTLAQRGADAPPTPFHVRGLLAGRAIKGAIDAGALCPEELAAHLGERLDPHPYTRGRGFLDLAAQGVRVPVLTVTRGRTIAAQ